METVDIMDTKPMPQLPLEILLLILECLPGSFFQQNLSRLVISKQWYSFAFPVFYSRIEYTPRVISRLVHGKSQPLMEVRTKLCKTARSVNIVLEGDAVNRDTSCFNTSANLIRFSLMLHKFKELKSVSIAARWQNTDWPSDPLQTNYLSSHSLELYFTHLSQHLTSLDLDLCGTHIFQDYRHDGDTPPVHLCPYIRFLLSRLRVLRLRAKYLCPFALHPIYDPDPDLDNDNDLELNNVKPRPITLTHLSINLYLGQVSPVNPKLNCTRVCGLPLQKAALPPSISHLNDPVPVETPPRPPFPNRFTFPPASSYTFPVTFAPPSPPASPPLLAQPWLHWPWSTPLFPLRARLKELVKLMPEPAHVEMVHLARDGTVHVWDAASDECVRDCVTGERRGKVCFEDVGDREGDWGLGGEGGGGMTTRGYEGVFGPTRRRRRLMNLEMLGGPDNTGWVDHIDDEDGLDDF